MGDHGDSTLIVDGGNCIGEGQPGRHAGSQAGPEQVAFAGGDLLPDYKLDQDSLVARTSDQLSGYINPVVVGQDGNLQIARPERRVHSHRRLGADPIAPGVNVEISVADGWTNVHPADHHRSERARGDRPTHAESTPRFSGSNQSAANASVEFPDLSTWQQ